MPQKVTVKKDYHNSRFDRWFKANIIDLPQSLIQKISGTKTPIGFLDITFHRDDFRDRLVVPQVKGTDINAPIDLLNIVVWLHYNDEPTLFITLGGKIDDLN